MNVAIGTEATQFPEKEYTIGIFVAVPLLILYRKQIKWNFYLRVYHSKSIKSWKCASIF
jgi:hypothetical protein